MQITRKIKIDIKKTVENSVGKNDDFHFFVDELTSENYMPTYGGMADEKYSFEEMNDEFFKFLYDKASQDGIYIRLIYASCMCSSNLNAIFELEFNGFRETFETDDFDNILEFEFADFGVKVKGDEITLGTTVERGCHHTPYFAEFGSTKGNKEFLSLDNPLNQYIISIMEKMIFEDW